MSLHNIKYVDHLHYIVYWESLKCKNVVSIDLETNTILKRLDIKHV